MDSINFQARFQKNVTVSARTNSNRFISKELPLLKINMDSKSDIQALRAVCEKWKKSDSFVNLLLLTLNDRCHFQEHNIYVLTSQRNGFRKLNPNEVFGIADVTPLGSMNRIDYLQTNPKYEFKNTTRKYKNIGKAIVNFLTNKSGNHKTYLDSRNGAVDFYKNCGFQVVNSDGYFPLMVYESKTKKGDK